MKKAGLATMLLAVAFLAKGQERSLSFNLQPGLGITLSSVSNAGGERRHLEWLLNVESGLNYRTKNFHFDSDLNLNFGQIAMSGAKPETTQDLFMINLMPSVKLFKRKHSIKPLFSISAKQNVLAKLDNLAHLGQKLTVR